MIATRDSAGNVTVTMTAAEAAEVENFLLWAHLDDEPATDALWDALAGLDDQQQPRRNAACPECGAHAGSGTHVVHGIAAAHHPACGTPESPFRQGGE